MKKMRCSDWQYLGCIFAAVGGALTLSGAIALYSLQQGLLLKKQYASSFLPVLLVGVFVTILGLVAFFRSLQKKRAEIPPAPSTELPPPPPP